MIKFCDVSFGVVFCLDVVDLKRGDVFREVMCVYGVSGSLKRWYGKLCKEDVLNDFDCGDEKW